MVADAQIPKFQKFLIWYKTQLNNLQEIAHSERLPN